MNNTVSIRMAILMIGERKYVCALGSASSANFTNLSLCFNIFRVCNDGIL